MLGYLIERLQQCRLVHRLVITTSVEPEDDAVAALAKDLSVCVFRGSLDDVAGRMLAAAQAYSLASFVRISGDSPLMDAELVDRAIDLFESVDADLVTNTFPRSFPKGMSVEVIGTSVLERVLGATDDPQDLEHVTRYIYAHPDDFRIQNFSCDQAIDGLQLSVDTPADLEQFSRVLGLMTKPHTEYKLEDVVALLGRESDAPVLSDGTRTR